MIAIAKVIPTDNRYKGMGLSQNRKQGVSVASRNALFYRCGATPDLLAILQVNPVLSTPIFASVYTLAVLAILLNRILHPKKILKHEHFFIRKH